MPIRDALRISMSIPIFFEPVRVDDHVFVDGGLVDNFPLCIFDSDVLDHCEARGAEPNMKTLGLFLQEDKTRQSVTRKISSMKEFMACLLDTVKLRIALLSMKPGDEKRTLFIQTHYVSSTKFKISQEDKELLYHEGEKAARKFYQNAKLEFSPELSARKASLYGAPIGRLVVQLKEGVELKKRRIICNLFCLLTLGKVAKKSSTRFRSTNPIWNENFVFPVTDDDEVLKLEVFDYHVRTPHLMGSSSILLSDLTDQPQETWQNIGKGKVLLQVTLSTIL